MSITRGIVRVLFTPWCTCLRVVDYEVNQVRDLCYWMSLRMPCKRTVCRVVCLPVVFVFLSCLAWTLFAESKQVKKYAINLLSVRHVREDNWRQGLDDEQTTGYYRRYIGEDVSLRCVIPEKDLGLNYKVKWLTKEDSGDVWLDVPSKHHHETVYDYVDGATYAQLDLISIDENDFKWYLCWVYNFKTHSIGDPKYRLIHLTKIHDSVTYIYEPAGSFVDLTLSFLSVESTKYDPPSGGYELNGVDFRQFENESNRCSPFLFVAKSYNFRSWISFDWIAILTGEFQYTNSIMNIDEMTLIPSQSDREPLLDFNRQTKTWITAKFCMDNRLHGVLQFYFNRTRYNDILGEYETAKIYFPVVWVLNPNGVNNLLNPADALGKEGRVKNKPFDPNDISVMKTKLRMMHSDDRFNIGVETHINFEILVVLFSVASFAAIISYLTARSLLAIERLFIYARSLASMCHDRANDDRKDIYILCSEAGLGWTCNHVLFPLERRGVTTWVHQRNVLPGSLKIDGVLDGVEQCRKIVIVLTPDFADHGLDYFFLKNLLAMIAEGRVSADNVLIINKNGDQKQIEEFKKCFKLKVISSKCFTEMTEKCLSGIHKWSKHKFH